MSQLGLGNAFTAIGQMYDDADRQRELDKQRAYQAAQLALQQAQERRAQEAMQFDQSYKLAAQTPAGTVVTPDFEARLGKDFSHFMTPEMKGTQPMQGMGGMPSIPSFDAPTGRKTWGGFEDAKTRASSEAAEAKRQDAQSRFQATMQQRQALQNQREKLARDLASIAHDDRQAALQQALTLGIQRLDEQIRQHDNTLAQTSWFQQQVAAPLAGVRADVAVAGANDRGGTDLAALLAGLQGGTAPTPTQSPRVTSPPIPGSPPPAPRPPNQRPSPAPRPAPAPSASPVTNFPYKIGQEVTLKGAGRVRITRIYPDGTFDHEPVVKR